LGSQLAPWNPGGSLSATGYSSFSPSWGKLYTFGANFSISLHSVNIYRERGGGGKRRSENHGNGQSKENGRKERSGKIRINVKTKKTLEKHMQKLI
jgi:hypothetical protein